jgi:hypothetical protein
MSLFGGLANDMGMGSLMAKSYLTLKVLEQQNILKGIAFFYCSPCSGFK